VNRVAVTAGGGKTGTAVAAALVAQGRTAVPLGHENGDLARALAGCSALVVIAPNLHPDEAGFVAALLDAAQVAGVGRVVYHSVAAPYSPSMPHHLGKAAAEDLVRRSGLDWTVLQPCAYVQNLVPALRAAPAVLEVPYSLDASFGLVDLADVAAAHAAVLTGPGPAAPRHVGATYELGGPAPVTVRDVARVAAAVTGRPVAVRQVSVEEWRAGPGAGLPGRERSWLEAMFGYYDAHGLPAGGLALGALLGRRPADLTETLTRELRG
jgi:uncharacterized protein YbjT (DUF2867 family)